jgi:cobalt transporter subunit CbtB
MSASSRRSLVAAILGTAVCYWKGRYVTTPGTVPQLLLILVMNLDCMSSVDSSVQNRFEQLFIELTPAQLAVGLMLLVVVGAVVLFVQEPLVHDAMHNFRHVAGITCH